MENEAKNGEDSAESMSAGARAAHSEGAIPREAIPNEAIFNFELELDSAEMEQRSTATPLLDEQIRLLLRENRLGLWRGRLKRYTDFSSGKPLIDLPLRCIAHTHPDCQFRWVRLTANFAAATGNTQGVIITDIIPREAIEKNPVKIILKSSSGLSFETEQFKIGPHVTAEKSQEYQTYFPELRTSGIGFTSAIWQFQALPDAVLHVDCDLHVRATVPATMTALTSIFTLRGRLAMNGITGLIPVIGSRTIALQIVEENPLPNE